MKGWPTKAAFVIQFRDGTDFATHRVIGNVEHIASYQAARFRSVDELLAFMRRVLSDLQEFDRS